MIRILITASRNWTNEQIVMDALLKTQYDFLSDEVTVVQGGAAGGDLIAAAVANIFGWCVEQHDADWNAHGKAAGFIRNQAMVDRGADVCLAFLKPCIKANCRAPMPHYSHGATDCVRRAEQAGISVRRYESPEQ